MTRPEFDIKKAGTLIHLSIEAYKPTGELDLSPFGLELIKEIDEKKTGTQAFIAEDAKKIVIAFRGSSSVKDVLIDIAVNKVCFPRVRRWFFKPRVHSGFFAAYSSVQGVVLNTIKELYSKKPRQVIITGHSLGGALGTLAAFDIANTLSIRPTLYTFGCPRVGNRWFIRKYHGKVKHSFRIVNDDDIVPHLPKVGYKDAKTLVLLDDDGNYEVGISPIEKFVEDLDSFLKLLTLEAIRDHGSKQYAEAIGKSQ